MKYIEVKDLTLVLDNNLVLWDVSVKLESGRVYGFLGPSGSGKSVFIKTIFGIFKPVKGTINFENVDKVAIQFQEGGLFDSLNVAENVAFQILKGKKLICELDDELKYQVFNKVLNAARFLNLTDALFKFPEELSGGMKKRAVLGRALIDDPDVLVLDDPVAGLDPINTTSAVKIISSIISRYKPITIIVTHNFRAFWDLFTDICFFEKGRLVYLGSKSEAIKQERVYDFLKCKLR